MRRLRFSAVAVLTLAYFGWVDPLFALETKSAEPLSASRPEFAPEPFDWQKLPPHPRLFATAQRVESLRAQNDPVSLQLKELLRNKADRFLNAPPISYSGSDNILEAMRNVQDRILTLSLLYRLTNEARYFEAARKELLQLAALPNWGTNHFLDVAEASIAAGVGLDWLHDALTADDRKIISDAIINRALLPSLDVPEGPSSWVRGDFNWNQVCHCGLTVGALAVAEVAPELARKIIDRAVDCVPAAGAAYAPDGSSSEGPSYWSYGATFQAILIDAMRGVFGNAAGLDSLPGFLKSVDFKLQMRAPGGEEFNYADYHTEHSNNPVMLWFARELDRRDVAEPELQALGQLANAAGNLHEVSRHTVLEVLWWKPKLQPIPSALPLHWTASGHLPMAVMRSAWNDPRATFLAIKGGTPNGSHAHMDVGSFVLEMNGVRWAIDLGTESYDRMRAAKIDLWNYSQDSSRWTVFREGPEGHNILRFDNARQNVAGHAGIQTLPDAAGAVGNVVDLTSLYAVENVRREVRLMADRSVTITDHWNTGAQPVEYSFQWLTAAKVTRVPTGCVLEQAGEKVELRIESSANFEIAVEDISQPRGPQDSPNPGVSRITFHQKTGANEEAHLSIHAFSAK